MYDTIGELLEKIRLGEDSYFEAKEIRLAGTKVRGPAREAFADELAAFANARGGVCLLGVEDGTREVIGIPEQALDPVEDFVREVCNDLIKPALDPVIEKLMLPSVRGTPAAVIKIEVPRSLFVHQSPGGYFHRVGSSKRIMSPEYLARLFQQRSQARIIRFDEQVVPGSRISDLDETLWRRFGKEQSHSESADVFLQKLGLARIDDHGVCRPSVSGVLMASNDPRAFIKNAFIQAVAYIGKLAAPSADSAAYQLDAADIIGPLDSQVAGALRFVARNMKTAASKSLGRTDTPQYSLGALIEAFVNAVAHRDYAIYGSKIRLRLFEDRLELYVPGALANTMTVDSLMLRQSVRNEVLTSLLARCPVPRDIPGLITERTTMMDKRGEGVRIIMDATAALSGKQPFYQLIDGEELLLTIPAANLE